MTTDLADAVRKYIDKIRGDAGDLEVSWMDLIDVANGGTVYKTIPLRFNPQLRYGADEDDDDDDSDGDGSGKGGKPADMTLGVDRRKIIEIEKNWGLKFTRKGKKTKKYLEYMLSEYGNQENQEQTIKSMIERQIMTSAYDPKNFKIEVKEEDMRYDIANERVKPYESAYFIMIKDVSWSMENSKDLSNLVSLYIDIGLSEMYKDKVTKMYMIHTDNAVEVSQSEYFRAAENGGTSFVDVYKTVESMLNGTSYKSKVSHKKIDFINEDVYVLHITDGGNLSRENGEVLSIVKGLLPKITKLMYLEIGDSTYMNMGIQPSTSFMNELMDLKSDKVSAVSTMNKEEGSIRKVVPKLFN